MNREVVKIAKERIAKHAEEGMLFCPVCENAVEAFGSFGVQDRSGAQCPECGALERHRLAILYLEAQASALPEHARVLHVAPEPAIENWLRQLPSVHYLSVDIEPEVAMQQMDLTAIDSDAESWDFIFCSHVLEHIPDDGKAMQELYRVLAPGGRMFVQVPMRREPTFEDPSITDPEDRLKHFGQRDHVRIYGPDLADRLAQAGFKVQVEWTKEAIPSRLIRRMGLGVRSMVICDK